MPVQTALSVSAVLGIPYPDAQKVQVSALEVVWWPSVLYAVKAAA